MSTARVGDRSNKIKRREREGKRRRGSKGREGERVGGRRERERDWVLLISKAGKGSSFCADRYTEKETRHASGTHGHTHNHKEQGTSTPHATHTRTPKHCGRKSRQQKGKEGGERERERKGGRKGETHTDTQNR